MIEEEQVQSPVTVVQQAPVREGWIPSYFGQKQPEDPEKLEMIKLEGIRLLEKKYEDVVEDEEVIRKQAKTVHLAEWRKATGSKPNRTAPAYRRTRLLSQAYRNMLGQADPEDPEARSYAHMIAIAMVTAAKKGDVMAARELREVTEGKTPQKIEIETNGDATLTLEHVLIDATDDELDGLIDNYVGSAYPILDGDTLDSRGLEAGGGGSDSREEEAGEAETQAEPGE